MPKNKWIKLEVSVSVGKAGDLIIVGGGMFVIRRIVKNKMYVTPIVESDGCFTIKNP